MFELDLELKQFATPTQWDKFTAVEKYGSQRKAAEALGCNKSTINSAIKAVHTKAAKAGYAPKYGWNHPAPPGFKYSGMSTLRDVETGKAKIVWEKITEDREQQDAARKAALKGMLEEIPKPEQIVLNNSTYLTGLLNQYTITDFHLGMVAWGEECGEDYDTKIAETLLINWFAAAIKQSPAAEVGLLCQLGDFLHWDGLDAVTPASKHLLDADTRFQNVVRTAVRVLRQVINLMRAKYPHVHIIMADANHDPASSVWLREMLAAMYEDEENVTVDTSPDTYYAYGWGDVSLFYHHGHKKTVRTCSEVFAAKFRDLWGNTKHSYAHLGHLHHLKVDETNLMVAEQHRTLAAKDAYSSRGGYLAGRSASVITYHKEFGEVGRVTLTPEMFK